MKFTVTTLRKVIREALLREGWGGDPGSPPAPKTRVTCNIGDEITTQAEVKVSTPEGTTWKKTTVTGRVVDFYRCHVTDCSRWGDIVAVELELPDGSLVKGIGAEYGIVSH